MSILSVLFYLIFYFFMLRVKSQHQTQKNARQAEKFSARRALGFAGPPPPLFTLHSEHKRHTYAARSLSLPLWGRWRPQGVG